MFGYLFWDQSQRAEIARVVDRKSSLIIAGGILATTLIVILINLGYNGLTGTLPFIPLPSREN